MASSKRQSNGRSPLVNPQRQITSFFSKNTSPSPSPSPSPPFSRLNPDKLKPKPKPSPNPSSQRSTGPSPTTPSALQSKRNKHRLVIGENPSPLPPSTPATTKSYGEEVSEKRIRVYWPLDKAWYEGFVKSFDKECNKHLIQYEDGEEELLDLGKEKIEWIQGSVTGFKRLRRGSSLAFKKVVIEDDEEMETVEEENSGSKSDSSGDNWDKKAEKEQLSEDEEVDLVDEQEEKMSRGKKRKADGGGKKSKSGGNLVKGGFKVSVMEPVKNLESK